MERPTETIITEVLTTMGFSDFTIDVCTDDTGTTYKVHVPDGRFLIGHQGANLFALNHVIKRIVEHETGVYGRFSIDVNSYQEERNESLKQRARMLADRVRSLASDTELEPMDAYERMIVHAALAESKDITTESTGRGLERRVVIKYQPKKEDELTGGF